MNCARKEVMKMRCELCRKRRARPHLAARAPKDALICRTCQRFIEEFIDTGLIPRGVRIPAVADVLLVMRRLGVSQDLAVRLLGGTP